METYIKLSELQEFPIRRNHCDKENANPHFINGIETVMEYAEALGENAEEVSPIIHAKWIGKPIAGYSDVRCSNCKTMFSSNKGRWKFCPECGAKMINSGHYNAENTLWKTNHEQAYKELIAAVEPLREFYNIDEIKPYAVYIWTKDKYDNWGVHFGSNVFDIWANDICFYTQNHCIPNEAMPIIRNIQSKLRNTT